ncbi:AAA family ATPase [Pseudoflavonifractor phocaeensis]|uniref:AAA family ATPase n=1 Tax=Pseudoflavonifractor phocaeensis TaxID=1870988 RepID=UPI001DA97AC1|nr:AAA family ATPase [Pseudoflavonifractor phocaeensis]MBM6724784.1 AAA family ATPase [Pseudoflavonifractor phocaeensis]
MGKILGIEIQNYGSLKHIKMGKLFSDQSGTELGNMVAIIGPSGNGKSTLADAFGFISDCLSTDVESACDANNRGGYDQLISQGSSDPIHFEIYYKENNNSRPITYELTIAQDALGRPYVKEERLRQRRANQKNGRPLSFLYLVEGKGYAFVGADGGQSEDGSVVEGERIEVELADTRKLGIVTLGAMKQYSRIELFLDFLKSWYLCYFTPDAARQIQTAAPAPYLNRTGSNLNNVAQYMYRENPKEFRKILEEIQTKIPNIQKIEPVKLKNGQMVLEFWQKGFEEPFFSPRMSDGTLKLFAYYLLLHERNPRQLVFVEEPENGLYHQYLANLAIEMRKSVGTGYEKQLFVTTHSPFFVNALSPEQVWVLEKQADGFSTAKQASTYAFVQDMVDEGAMVGDLWYSEYFG